MTEPAASTTPPQPADILVPCGTSTASRPVWLVREGTPLAELVGIDPAQRAWLEATAFEGAARKHALLPAADGGLGGAVLGLGDGEAGDPCGPSELLAGVLPGVLPAGCYRLAAAGPHDELAAISWALGAYAFRRYKEGPQNGVPALELGPGVDRMRAVAIAEGVWLGRDLINTPSNDMGPAELEAAARALAARHGASVSSIVGDDLLRHNFPLIHTVGRASARSPRLLELRWGESPGPRITLVGKGICFDTGGLDLKPAAGMRLMKKDMGGAAAALAVGHMIMSLGLGVRLRILLAIAENSVSCNAYRPGDVIRSRAGRTVEIGNTDAEGRLVLCDALALADEEAPDLTITLATLTGAARTALGPDLPALFCDDDAFAAELVSAGAGVGDPVWRMPFWSGYERTLDSEVADMSNVSEGPFAGAVTAALFLRRFVRKSRRYAHLDIYGWRTTQRPLGPKGGEPQAARALLEVATSLAAGRARGALG